jgi:quercetin dioxygenase-like cupin family protein
MFSACAICAAGGLFASDAGAQSQPGGFKRTIVSRIDGPIPGYETISARLEIEPGTPVARHTHAGVESSYVISGAAELTVEGGGARTYGPGETFQVAAGVPHGGRNLDQPTVIAATYVVEKGKPLATPA